MTLVGSLCFTINSPPIISAGGRVPRGTGVMCTNQGLLLKAHDDPLYLLNHAYDGLRCGAPTVIREAPLVCQTMVCSAKLYNQRLATLFTYHQLTPMSRRHHIYAVEARGGAMLYKPVFLTGRTPRNRYTVHCNAVIQSKIIC